ncbi:MAG: hypothetical protein Q4G66_11125 [bacterium]|nr:hypothetical protein [bacterium]
MAEPRRKPRTAEFIETLHIARLMGAYLDEDMRAGELVQFLTETAKVLQIGNWEDVNKGPALTALRAARKSAPVWIADHRQHPWLPKDESQLIVLETMWALSDARAIMLEAVELIWRNRMTGGKPYAGLDEFKPLHLLLGKTELLGRGELKFKDDTHYWQRNVLNSSRVDGEDLFELDALVAALFEQFLTTKGWAYLTKCSECGQLFTPRRTDARTCGDRCRKRRSVAATGLFT